MKFPLTYEWLKTKENEMLTPEEILIGLTILDIIWPSDDGHITFGTNIGDITFKGYGNCCSFLGMDTFDYINNLIGLPILAVEIKCSKYGILHINAPVEQVQIIGYEFITKKGHSLLQFLNNSDSNYSGDLYFVNITKREDN